MANCPLCLSQSSKLHVDEPKDREYFVARSQPAAILRCLNCSSLYQSPKVSLDEANSFYTSTYQNYFQSGKSLLKSVATFFLNRAAQGFHLQWGSVGNRVLDYGC